MIKQFPNLCLGSKPSIHLSTRTYSNLSVNIVCCIVWLSKIQYLTHQQQLTHIKRHVFDLINWGLCIKNIQPYLESADSSSTLTYHRGGGSFPFFSCIEEEDGICNNIRCIEHKYDKSHNFDIRTQYKTMYVKWNPNSGLQLPILKEFPTFHKDNYPHLWRSRLNWTCGSIVAFLSSCCGTEISSINAHTETTD